MGDWLFWLVIAIVSNLIFWGGIIYVVIKIFKSEGSLKERTGKASLFLNIVTMGRYCGGSSDKLDSEAGRYGAKHGININDPRD